MTRHWHRWHDWRARRHWLFHHSMRKRVFRWLFASTLAVAAVTALVVHLGGGRAWLILPALWVLGVASSLIARQLARPLEEVARFADALGGGDLGARIAIPRHAGRDIAVVERALNQMADRIGRQIDDQRALLGAVSHELRSPLQRMKIAIELVRGGDPTPLEKLEREVRDMDRLVGDLLAGSRIDFNALHRREQNAVELALAALERLEEPPDKLNVEAQSTLFQADPTLALHAVSNLVENARRHGGGLKELRVTSSGQAVRFSALDDGPGFAPDERERIFLPFQQTSTPSSIGLGLSIVRRIAEAHGGRAFADNRPGGGAEVAIEFPVAVA
jgi:signal transduction histidine kinase